MGGSWKQGARKHTWAALNGQERIASAGDEAVLYPWVKIGPGPAGGLRVEPRLKLERGGSSMQINALQRRLTARALRRAMQAGAEMTVECNVREEWFVAGFVGVLAVGIGIVAVLSPASHRGSFVFMAVLCGLFSLGQLWYVHRINVVRLVISASGARALLKDGREVAVRWGEVDRGRSPRGGGLRTVNGEVLRFKSNGTIHAALLAVRVRKDGTWREAIASAKRLSWFVVSAGLTLSAIAALTPWFLGLQQYMPMSPLRSFLLMATGTGGMGLLMVFQLTFKPVFEAWAMGYGVKLFSSVAVKDEAGESGKEVGVQPGASKPSILSL